MAVLVDNNPKVICQDLTGWQGAFHSEPAIAQGGRNMVLISNPVSPAKAPILLVQF